MLVFDAPVIAILIFLVTYGLIISHKVERAIVAMAGALAVWALGVLSVEQMFSHIDWNTLGLLFGMMIIVGVLREEHFFRWVGIYLANFCRCRPHYMFILFILITALLSAILDNVTTVLFMIAITVEIMHVLEVNPVPFIISEIVAANIGGTATMIGDPPNIMIAHAGGISFTDFIVNVTPITVVALVVTTFVLYLFYRNKIEAKKQYTKMPIKPSEVITNPIRFRFNVIAFVVVVLFFFLSDTIDLEVSAIALIGSIVLLFFGGSKMPEILDMIEWRVLIFFACLIIIVGGLSETGIILMMSEGVATVIDTNSFLAVTVILWLSAFASAFIDNIPFTATFIPLLQHLAPRLGMDISILWWTLALAAGFGGTGTTIASSASIVGTGQARRLGYEITFGSFIKIGLTVMIITTAIANLLLLLMLLL